MPDPATLLRSLQAHLRPGGIVVFQEALLSLWYSIPECPQHHQCRHWILDAFERAGLDCEMGGKLFAAFVEAGLPAPQMICTARVEAGALSPVYEWIAETLRSMLPLVERYRVATAAEVDIESLAARLRSESVSSRASIVAPPLVGAWARV